MTAALGELVMVFIGDQRTVDIFRDLPAKRLIQTVVLGSGGNILIAPDDMSDAHQMVIHHVGEIIGRETVGLDEDHVVQFFVFHSDIPVELVVEGRCTFLRVVLTDDIGHTGGEVLFNLLFGQMQAVLVVDVDLLAFNGLCQC